VLHGALPFPAGRDRYTDIGRIRLQSGSAAVAKPTQARDPIAS
jgi:hypothetical protein